MGRNNNTVPPVKPKQVEKDKEKVEEAVRTEAEEQPQSSKGETDKKRTLSECGSASGSDKQAHKRQHAGSSSSSSVGEDGVKEDGLQELTMEKDNLLKDASVLLGATEEGRNIMAKLNSLFDRTQELVRSKLQNTVEVEKMRRQVREAVLREVQEDKELEILARTVSIHGILKLKDTFLDGSAPLEDIITDVIHNITRTRVVVMSCRIWRAAEDNKPKSASVVLGSKQQKDALYRYVATHMRLKSQWHQFLQGMSFRDMVPREYMEEAQDMLKRAADMKRKEAITGYKIKTVGKYCLPALVVRSRQRGWHIYEVAQRRTEARIEDSQDGGSMMEMEDSFGFGEASGASQKGPQGRTKKREKEIRDHKRREDSLERLRLSASKDPDSYLGKLEDEERRAARTAQGYYERKVEFLKSMEGTEWMAERNRKEEESYAEAY